MKSMSSQQRALQRRWPGFTLVFACPGRAIWLGTVRPIERPHRVLLDYEQPANGVDVRQHFPRARIVDPPLRPRYDGHADGPLPHVYFDRDNLLLSALCLFDPTQDEWSHDDLLADTTIPWIADWLACYEVWLVTGTWLGGGRHPGEYAA